MRLFLVLALFALSACAETQFLAQGGKMLGFGNDRGSYKIGKPYQVEGTWYYPKEEWNYVETGIASWYGDDFHGKYTANGESYDMNSLTAAHRTLQLPSIVRVTNLENGRALNLRVNDRGPFLRGRIIDVSARAAELLGFRSKGTARVKVEVLPIESRQVAREAGATFDPRSPNSIQMARRQNARQQFAQQEPEEPKPAMPLTLVESQDLPPLPGNIIPASNAPPAIAGNEQPLLNPAGVVENSAIRAEPLSPPAPPAASSPSKVDGLVRQVPVKPTNLYVQAGAFSNPENALKLQQKLQKLGKVTVTQSASKGKQFYRVRFGPMQSVSHADKLLDQVVKSGISNARIVVD
ncbi:MAG: septal ring lytic transglycosylase RlpA family protein [Dongiaceae bacterium]